MSAQPQLMLLFSLAENPRGQLVDWYEDVQTQARSLCAPYDPAGALSLASGCTTRVGRLPRQHQQPS